MRWCGVPVLACSLLTSVTGAQACDANALVVARARRTRASPRFARLTRVRLAAAAAFGIIADGLRQRGPPAHERRRRRAGAFPYPVLCGAHRRVPATVLPDERVAHQGKPQNAVAAAPQRAAPPSKR